MGRPKKNPDTEVQVDDLTIAPFEAWYNEKTGRTLVALVSDDGTARTLDTDTFGKVLMAAGWERMFNYDE